MSESDGDVNYYEKFAYTPTRLTNGKLIWWKYYWVKSIHYEPPMKGESMMGYPIYTSAVYSFLSQKEYEIDMMLDTIKNAEKK